MKKKFSVVFFTICVLALTMGLLVGCSDNKPSGETDPIIGSWIGRDEARNRDFYLAVSNQENNSQNVTFDIEIKEIEHDTLKTKVLDSGKLKKTDKYVYNGNLTHIPLNNGATKYEYIFNIENDKIHVTGKEFTGGYNATYRFERTDLTLEQFELQIKDSLIVNENDPIVGNWFWMRYKNGDAQYSYVKITLSKEYPNLININVKNLQNEELISGQLCKNLLSSKNKYKFIGDFSPFGEYSKDEFKYDFELDGNDNIIVTGEEKRPDASGSIISWRKVVYNLKQTDLTLEQFEEQMK